MNQGVFAIGHMADITWALILAVILHMVGPHVLPQLTPNPGLGPPYGYDVLNSGRLLYLKLYFFL